MRLRDSDPCPILTRRVRSMSASARCLRPLCSSHKKKARRSEPFKSIFLIPLAAHFAVREVTT